jgi:TonB family protein
MNGRGPETPGGGHEGRGVDAVVWVAVIAMMVGVAGGVAWLASSLRFELPKITFSDGVEEVILIEPVPPPVVLPVTPPPEPPPSIGPDGEIVKAPVWVRAPAPEYPELAARRGIESGAVTLLCEALASGEVGACDVLAEYPAGAGFADAARRGARGARVRPRNVDGVETDSLIRYTVRFRLEP